jgi:hypothetical protein
MGGEELSNYWTVLKEKYRKFKEEALDSTLRRTRFRKGCGHVVRQKT